MAEPKPVFRKRESLPPAPLSFYQEEFGSDDEEEPTAPPESKAPQATRSLDELPRLQFPLSRSDARLVLKLRIAPQECLLLFEDFCKQAGRDPTESFHAMITQSLDEDPDEEEDPWQKTPSGKAYLDDWKAGKLENGRWYLYFEGKLFAEADTRSEILSRPDVWAIVNKEDGFIVQAGNHEPEEAWIGHNRTVEEKDKRLSTDT